MPGPALFFDRANWVGRSSYLPISDAEARGRHERREAYGVYFPAQRLELELYFTATYCATNFLAGNGKPELSYSFEERDSRLFLFEAGYYAYDEHGKVTSYDEYYFTPDGKVTITKHSGAEHVVGTNTVDVTGNWEPIPAFGEFRALLRRER